MRDTVAALELRFGGRCVTHRTRLRETLTAADLLQDVPSFIRWKLVPDEDRKRFGCRSSLEDGRRAARGEFA